MAIPFIFNQMNVIRTENGLEKNDSIFHFNEEKASQPCNICECISMYFDERQPLIYARGARLHNREQFMWMGRQFDGDDYVCRLDGSVFFFFFFSISKWMHYFRCGRQQQPCTIHWSGLLSFAYSYERTLTTRIVCPIRINFSKWMIHSHVF